MGLISERYHPSTKSIVSKLFLRFIYSFSFIFQRSMRQQQCNARADRWIAIFGSAG
jgi:hypothetical protein